MAYASCPTSIVDAPVETIWRLLTRPEKWGEFFDLHVLSVELPGPAAVGQTIVGESGPRRLRLKLRFRFTKVDNQNYQLGFDARLPFGVTVREDLSCARLGVGRCRVSYNCNWLSRRLARRGRPPSDASRTRCRPSRFLISSETLRRAMSRGEQRGAKTRALAVPPGSSSLAARRQGQQPFQFRTKNLRNVRITTMPLSRPP